MHIPVSPASRPCFLAVLCFAQLLLMGPPPASAASRGLLEAARRGGVSVLTEPVPEVRVALQPLGDIDPALLEQTRLSILQRYAVSVEVLPRQPLPASAWYAPRSRYLAPKVLDFLEAGTDHRYQKVVGLTGRDISNVRGQGGNWGILGLGYIGERPCVISSYRLGRTVSRDVLAARLAKVVTHELGHTFGLEHCPVRGCLMHAAEGSIRTLDGEKGTFCSSCRERLQVLGVLRQG